MNSLFMLDNFSKLFMEPAHSYPKLSPQLNFSDYIRQCKTWIKTTRLDLQTNANHIIDSNAPFELHSDHTLSFHTPLKKIKYGILLIHGLLDCPFTMRDIGAALHTNDVLIRAILLPGHGTIPGALLHTDYTEWVNTVQFGVETLAKEVDTIFLVGFSTGGTLALYHAIHYPKKIAGVVLISPALKINSIFDFLAKWPAKLGKRWPRAAWFHQDKEETLDYTRYRSTPFNAAYQVYRLAHAVKQVDPPACPLFFILSLGDLTVSSQVCITYFLKNQNPKNKMLLYQPQCVNAYNDKRIIIRSSCFADKHIRDFSHLAIPIAPNNPHYGMHGDYREASHIENNQSIIYGEYYTPFMTFHNALFKLNWVAHQYQRLSFNPDFLFLSEQIKQFVYNASVG